MNQKERNSSKQNRMRAKYRELFPQRPSIPDSKPEPEVTFQPEISIEELKARVSDSVLREEQTIAEEESLTEEERLWAQEREQAEVANRPGPDVEVHGQSHQPPADINVKTYESISAAFLHEGMQGVERYLQASLRNRS